MDEVRTVDKSISSEMMMAQSEIATLFSGLDALPEIKISQVIDVGSNSLATSADVVGGQIEGVSGRMTREEPVVGLEKGKFVAVKKAGGYKNQWETYHLFCLREDGRFGTEFPLGRSILELPTDGDPIILYPDRDNRKLQPIKIEKTPASYKVTASTPETDPSYNKDRGDYYLLYTESATSFKVLDEDLINKSKQLLETVS